MFAGTHAYFTMEESRTCSVNYFCFGALLIFIGSILLCSLGFTVVLPFERTKAWPEVNCTVVRAEVNNSLCACEEDGLAYPGCSKFSPCLQVIIAYHAPSVYEVEYFVTPPNVGFEAMPKTDQINTKDSKAFTDRDHYVVKLPVHKHSINIKTNLSGGIEKGHTVLKTSERFSEGDMHDSLPENHITSPSSKDQKNIAVFDSYREAMLYRSWGDVFYTHVSMASFYIW